MIDFIPQIQPWIDEKELLQLQRVVDSTYVTEHKLTEEFESLIKKLTGAKHAVAVTNGTVGLFSALKALGIGEGDEVIVPNLTFIASSNAILMAGAKPVLCEINDDNFCIDAEKIEKLISPATKAIMPVHLYGQSCNMTALCSLAKKHNLYMVEDAAQGVGVKYNSKHVGTFGDVGVLSFYGNKTITCGEGGVILTECDEIRDEVYSLKNHGRLEKGKFKHEKIGFNFSFTEMQAAIGIAQLHKLPSVIEIKNNIHKKYHDSLKHLNDKITSINLDKNCDPVWWFTSFLTDYKSELKEYLLKNNIQTRDFFYPLHLQPCYKDYHFADHKFPVSENIYSKGISLPSSCGLTNEQQDYIIENIINFFKSK